MSAAAYRRPSDEDSTSRSQNQLEQPNRTSEDGNDLPEHARRRRGFETPLHGSSTRELSVARPWLPRSGEPGGFSVP